MARDINTKKLKKNAFRYSKVRGETASRIRIPGGVINAGSMAKIAEVAEKYGNGTIFVTNRQGVELPGIALEDMDAVNKMIQSIIDDSGVNQEERDKGYPASGTRNVVACPGQRLCPFGCYDTTALARKMDKMIFPNHLHVKIAFTGCSNDCGKVRMDDFGFIGMTEPQYDPDRCVSCEQCIKYCNIRSVGAIPPSASDAVYASPTARPAPGQGARSTISALSSWDAPARRIRVWQRTSSNGRTRRASSRWSRTPTLMWRSILIPTPLRAKSTSVTSWTGQVLMSSANGS